MKKSTKGALAASAAGVLLLGGAGSLAYWTATGDVPGGSITSGELKLSTGTCTQWKIDGGTDFDPTVATNKIVPGDTLTKQCTFTITASGNHLSADLSVNQPTFTNTANGLSSKLTTSASFTVAGNSITTITSANNSNTLAATVTVTFPYGGPASTPNPTTGADNLSQNLTAVLDKVTVTAVQKHA